MQTWSQKLNIFIGNIKSGDRLTVQSGCFEGERGTVVYFGGCVVFKLDSNEQNVYLNFSDLCPR